MKKLLFAILIVLAFVVPADATTYYACIAGNISAANAWEDAAGCDGTTFTMGTAGFPASGSLLEANALSMTIDTDPGPNGAVTLKNTAGGGFAVATSVTPITITANGTAVGAALLTISGNANANPALTIAGDTTWTGGDGNNENAINGTHTVGTVAFGSVGHPVTVVGGTASGAYGYYSATVSPISGYINGTGGAAGPGLGNLGAVGYAITGNCTGGSGQGAYGCGAVNSGVACYITVTGNLIAGSRGAPYHGSIRWTPTAPSSGVTGNYFKTDGGGTAVYVGTNTDDAAKALTTFYYIDPTDGGSDVGTASAGGGGGAWGF